MQMTLFTGKDFLNRFYRYVIVSVEVEALTQKKGKTLLGYEFYSSKIEKPQISWSLNRAQNP